MCKDQLFLQIILLPKLFYLFIKDNGEGKKEKRSTEKETTHTNQPNTIAVNIDRELSNRLILCIDFVFWFLFKFAFLFILFIFLFFFFFLEFIYLFLERGEGREKERERNINVWLPPTWPPLGTWPTTQACAPTGNQTSDPSVFSLRSTHWATPAGAKFAFLKKYSYN